MTFPHPDQAILLLLITFCPGPAWAEDAVLRDGQRIPGTLHHDKEEWTFRTRDGNKLPLAKLQLLRFPDPQTPTPRCRLLHQLVFPGGQRLVGELVKLDDVQVHFRFPSGELTRLSRGKVLGVTQVEGYATIFLADKDSREQAFEPKTGNPEILEGKVQVFLQSVNLKEAGEAKVLLQFAAPKERKTLEILLGPEGSLILDQVAKFPPRKKRRFLHLEFGNGRATVFLDDLLLGSAPMPKNAQLESLGLSQKPGDKSGQAIFEDLQILKRTSKPRLPVVTDQDILCLEPGDQLFGKLIQADEREVLIDARFGRRTYLWSRIHGIFFRPEANPLAKNKSFGPNVRVWFRSAPGQSADCLSGQLLNLDDDRLILLHEALGEYSIERKCLERLVFREAAK